MKSFLLILITLIALSSNVNSSDQLNSHEQFERGALPVIINYDPEFRPPMPMPQLESGSLPDDEEFDHLSTPTYDSQIIRKEDKIY
jgi:hypothetical protein